MILPKVFYSKTVSPEALIKVYEALGVPLSGRVAVKVSTGEDGSKGYLKADLIAPLVQKLQGTIVECNTAYPGSRNNVVDHLKTAEKHGFTSFASVDIMDASGEFKIPVNGGRHLAYDIVGQDLKFYDSMLNLAHGKGHVMGGFGGSLKNMSIGVASRNGKAYIHSCGHTEDPDACWRDKHEQIDFIESMAEAAKAVAGYFKGQGKPVLYITVMNALSLDCDCDSHQGDPVMADLGIIGSTDPVANDQAFLDLIWNSTDPGKDKLIERITSREGEKITKYAEEIGLGNTQYELIEV